MIDLASVGLMFIGTPYVWGGNDLTKGVDCSGFVCEVSRSVGLLDKRDLTAQGLYKYFVKLSNYSEVKRNSILFFGRSTKSITHVAIALDEKYMVEAGGEGSVATDKGYVRIRPIKNRRDLVSALVLE